jgi:hypothetical protein
MNSHPFNLLTKHRVANMVLEVNFDPISEKGMGFLVSFTLLEKRL